MKAFQCFRLLSSPKVGKILIRSQERINWCSCWFSGSETKKEIQTGYSTYGSSNFKKLREALELSIKETLKVCLQELKDQVVQPVAAAINPSSTTLALAANPTNIYVSKLEAPPFDETDPCGGCSKYKDISIFTPLRSKPFEDCGLRAVLLDVGKWFFAN